MSDSQWPMPPELDRFVETARRFTQLIETAHHYDLLERLVRCAAAVAELYAAGLYLPLQDAPVDPEEPPAPGTVSAWGGFEELTLFWQVPDAYAWGAPVVTSLSDALLNTYHEVKRGLLLFEKGMAESDVDIVGHAVWYWREEMEARWGTWLADALRALNRAIQKVSSGQRDF